MKVVFNNVHSLSSLQHILVPCIYFSLKGEGNNVRTATCATYHTVVGSIYGGYYRRGCFLLFGSCKLFTYTLPTYNFGTTCMRNGTSTPSLAALCPPHPAASLPAGDRASAGNSSCCVAAPRARPIPIPSLPHLKTNK